MRRRSHYDYENRLWLFMTREEEVEFFNEVCERIIRNPRRYLDDLNNFSVFRVSFNNYHPRVKKKEKVYK